MVESIEKRNLSLDSTDDVKEAASKEWEIYKEESANDVKSIYDEELASWEE